MDLFTEASTAGRVLAARHITADHTVPEVNKAINSSLLCYSLDSQPSFGIYLEAIRGFAPALWAAAAAAALATAAVAGAAVRSARRTRPGTLGHTTFVLVLYPVVAAMGLVSLVVPRSRLVAEAVAQQAVVVAMYHLFCLLVADSGGEDQLVRRADGARLETRVLPCCCWPCCVLPRPLLHRNKLTTLRYLVLQMPIVQGIIYAVVLMIWSESMTLYEKSFSYIQPLIATSILLGVWGVIMCVRAAEAAGSSPRARFLAVQLSLLVVKLQGGCVKVLPELFHLPCLLPLHPVVFVNLIHSSLMIVEMFLLSLWAWRLFACPDKSGVKMMTVVSAVLEETPKPTRHLEKETK